MNVEMFPALPMTPPAALALTPSQQTFYDQLGRAIDAATVVGIVGAQGSGRTTLISKLAVDRHCKVIDMSYLADALLGTAPGRSDEVIGARIIEALKHHDVVVVDDFEKILALRTNERESFLKQTIIPHVYDVAERLGKTLVLVGTSGLDIWWMPVPEIFGERAMRVDVPAFGSDDYAAVAANVLGKARVGNVDFRMLHRYAAMLDGHQLRLVCQLLANEQHLDTESFIRCLEDWILGSNLHIQDVETLTFDALPGAEHIAEALETHVVLPFENPDLAMKMGLKPKRGVLLYGPPGTGKTSIGRALAHRMKGKFFMIDGTFISEPPTAFFSSVQAVVAEAKANSPCVLFIDDADLLFEIEHIGGLARYLLSLLDGLESETASNVCVMMTAMDVRRVPEALLRSGRVELWLETRPPDEPTRARILKRWMTDGLPAHDAIDYAPLAGLAAGFTPADLRRVTGDARLLYAADVASASPLSTANEYLSAAIDDIIAVRDRMADQLGDDALRVGHRA